MRLAAAVAVLVLGVQALGQGLLDVGRERAGRVVVAVGEELAALEGKNGADESAMTRQLKEVLADLRGKELEPLRGCFAAGALMGDPTGAERVCVLHAMAGRESKMLEVVRTKEGAFIAVELGVERPRRGELKREKFGGLVQSWPQFRGGFGKVEEPLGEVFELGKPYTAGWHTLDQETLGDRFLDGAKTNVEGMNRVLEEEKLLCRLPKGYDAKKPAGVLVWVDPTVSGKPPAVFNAALDAMNLICVGAAGAGNLRTAANREQLALDGLATVARRYHIDPARVYITGMSGGGRISSMMVACFPEVFTGAVPIVGLACYEHVPTGVGQMWPRGYAKPGPAVFGLFKTRRMGAITGSRDFNQTEMQHATDIMRRDGVQVKLYDYPRMGHDMPTAERFAEVIAWVDEPAQKAREAGIAEARRLMQVYESRRAGTSEEVSRRMLVKVTEAALWSEEAWRAAGLLGLVPGGGDAGASR